MPLPLVVNSMHLSWGLAAGIIATVIAILVGLRFIGRDKETRQHHRAVKKGLKRVKRENPLRTEASRVALEDYLNVQNRVGRKDAVKRRVSSADGFVGGYFEDADDEAVYICWVPGFRRGLAHRDARVLAERAADVRAQAERGERVAPDECEYYFRDIQRGHVDLQETRDRIDGDARLRLQLALEEDDWYEVDDLLDKMVHKHRYPEQYVSSALKRLVQEGIVEMRDGEARFVGY